MPRQQQQQQMQQCGQLAEMCEPNATLCGGNETKAAHTYTLAFMNAIAHTYIRTEGGWRVWGSWQWHLGIVACYREILAE